jgi:hypothetical protein
MKNVCIIDDYFPNRLSLFRYIEFTTFLKKHNNWKLLTIAKDAQSHIDKIPGEIADRVTMLNYDQAESLIPEQYNGELCYTVNFILTIRMLPIYEKMKAPFMFTLYPGFGFRFDDGPTDDHLRRIFNSPYFEGVVITQLATLKYVEKFNIPKEKVKFSYGGFVDTDRTPLEKVKLGQSKDTLDVCFLACKYHPQGKDKGYDTFVEVAEALSEDKKINFHVLGNFDENVIPLKKANIKFYGFLDTNELADWFKDKDVMISLNRAGVLGPGSFDGFPTGASAEAGLNKCVLIITDPLENNPGFKSFYIEKDSLNVVEILKGLKDNPSYMYSVGEKTREELLNLLSIERQILEREELLIGSSFVI